MATALLAFFGSLAAVGLKGWVDVLFDSRRTARAVRTAARLIREELEETASHLRVALDSGSWPRHLNGALADDVWNEHKALVAAEVEPTTWTMLAIAYERVRWIRDDDYDPGAGLGDDVRDTLVPQSGLIESAVKRLDDLGDRDLSLRPSWLRLRRRG